MLDIKMIRQNETEIKRRLATRGVDSRTVDQLLAADQRRRELVVKTENLRQQKNEVSEQIAQAKRNKQTAADEISQMKQVGQQIKQIDEELKMVQSNVQDLASRLPNLPHPSIPIGPDEDSNVEIKKSWYSKKI